MNHKDRRQEILKAAIALFAKKGFRGTTTRDLATQAEINEAIIFRHFNTKDELYRAILEEKLKETRDRSLKVDQLLGSGDDRHVFETIGRTFLERNERESTFMRLLLFSALEGHELAEMFLANMEVRDPLAHYIQKRIDEGVFRAVDAHLAARAFVGMFVCYVQWQEIFGQRKKRTFDREEVVRTFVSIFLAGLKS